MAGTNVHTILFLGGDNLIGFDEVKTFLINNPDQIGDILEKMEFEDIRDRGTYLTFPNKDGDNKTACVIYKDTLTYKNYTRVNCDGDILTLVMNDQKVTLRQATNLVANWLGLSEAVVQIKRPFGGFYKSVLRPNDRPELHMPTYDESILAPYLHKFNKKFWRDGIDYMTQDFFNLGYCHDENAILIPTYTVDGDLCGCKARNNDPDCDYDRRWWAFIPYSKTYTLYGFHWNYQDILKKHKVILVESEKGVMQARSFGVNNVLAVSGSKISNTQVNYIRSLNCDEIIVAFDEGLYESEILIESMKLLPKGNKDYKVSYIFDDDNSILPKGSKCSPTDLGWKAFYSLLSNKKVVVENFE